MDMTRKRGRKNHSVLTKRELQKPLVLEDVDHRLRSKPYSFTRGSSDAEERERFFKFRTRKQAMDFFRARARRIAKEIKNGVIQNICDTKLSRYLPYARSEWHFVFITECIGRSFKC